MATTSLIPATRNAIHAALLVSLAGGGVQVSYSHPGDAVERETVYLGDATSSQRYATMKAGRRTRDEEFTIDVWIEVTTDGPDARAASERAWVLVGAVEDILATDATLGLPAPFWAGVGDTLERIGWDEDRRGSACSIRATIQCQGRLV